MIGAIAGDIIGSVYERDPIKTTAFPLFQPRSRFTDDSVLTVAVADAILSGRPYRDAVRDWGRRHPHAGYGGSFAQWLRADDPRPYHSWGNGAAMRVSPVGWAFATEAEILRQARQTAAITHDHQYGREYWTRHQVDRRLRPEQLAEIAETHLAREDALLERSNRYLFTDTNALTTTTFARYYHGTVEPRVDHGAPAHRELVLLDRRRCHRDRALLRQGDQVRGVALRAAPGAGHPGVGRLESGGRGPDGRRSPSWRRSSGGRPDGDMPADSSWIEGGGFSRDDRKEVPITHPILTILFASGLICDAKTGT